MAKSKISEDTVVKLRHVLKINRDSMTTTGVVYVEQAIKDVEDLLRLLDAAEAMASQRYFKPTVITFERILKDITDPQ